MWEIETVSKERAEKLGMEVRRSNRHQTQVRMDLKSRLIAS